MRWLLLCLLALGFAAPAAGQVVADTLFTWPGYARTGTCHLRIFHAPPGDDRTHTIVLQELAENRGPTTLDDARHLAEVIGRHYGIDPVAAYWVFHWGAFSYDAGAERGKELFLRATFGRTSTYNLGTPRWRVVTREEVEELTDRLYR